MTQAWDGVVLVCDADGLVESAVPSAVRLATDPPFTEALGAAVRSFVASEEDSAVLPLDGRSARLSRLVARTSLRVLVTVRSRESGGLRVLTPALRRVAELAALGASAREISGMLGTSFETVRTQLRDSYRRLGVSSREELASALAEE